MERAEEIRTRKQINLPDEIKATLAHQAIDFGTNLKNYIEGVCAYLAKKDKNDPIMEELKRFFNQ
ncbi:hypothetical protein FACS189452_10200 [Bacteroidia bacterium]|nr:hypothetical protein FACS189452_10200 [Bacteroidia bacterium]GHT81316.1 hypothetical protein FACS189467_5160 [Bacteroidia bacterium]